MWNTIIGHDRQKEQLRRAITGGSVPHAYLFSGIDGIGKRLTACAAASELLRRKINTEAQDPDFIIIEPDGDQITIDLIRNLKEQLKFAPLNGDVRVTIIDQAELMNPSAANAALKILEEPPPGNHFFLITSTPSMLLPTIISRCQRLEFSPLTDIQIVDYLTTQHGYAKDQAMTAAEMGEGSIGRAISITPDLIKTVITELTEAMTKKSASTIIDLSNRWSSVKEDIENILYIVHKCFHNALTVGAVSVPQLSPHGGGSSQIQSTKQEDILESLILSKNDPVRLAEKCSFINKTHALTRRTYNKQLMFEQLLFTLAG